MSQVRLGIDNNNKSLVKAQSQLSQPPRKGTESFFGIKSPKLYSKGKKDMEKISLMKMKGSTVHPSQHVSTPLRATSSQHTP